MRGGVAAEGVGEGGCGVLILLLLGVLLLKEGEVLLRIEGRLSLSAEGGLRLQLSRLRWVVA